MCHGWRVNSVALRWNANTATKRRSNRSAHGTANNQQNNQRRRNMTYPPYLEQFYQKHIQQIGESLDDFYHDFKHWKELNWHDLSDERAFSIYANELTDKWQRIARQEGYKK